MATKRSRPTLEEILSALGAHLPDLGERYGITSSSGSRGESPMEIRHYEFDRVTMNPEKCFGKPCIRGLRMPVASILSYLSSGMTVDEVLKEWPELESEDIYQALGYAAWMMEERVVLVEGSATS